MWISVYLRLCPSLSCWPSESLTAAIRSNAASSVFTCTVIKTWWLEVPLTHWQWRRHFSSYWRPHSPYHLFNHIHSSPLNLFNKPNSTTMNRRRRSHWWGRSHWWWRLCTSLSGGRRLYDWQPYSLLQWLQGVEGSVGMVEEWSGRKKQ